MDGIYDEITEKKEKLENLEETYFATKGLGRAIELITQFHLKCQGRMKIDTQYREEVVLLGLPKLAMVKILSKTLNLKNENYIFRSYARNQVFVEFYVRDFKLSSFHIETFQRVPNC